jgi:ATP-dependent exoDNAse (exonuclease V) alpha subunit
MEIKIDPEKDSIEKLDVVAKIIEEFKRAKNPDLKPKKTKTIKEKKSKTKFSKSDQFLLKKYKYYIAKTLIELSNRDMIPQSLDDEEPDFIRRLKKPALDEIFIEEKELFKEFTLTLEKDNIHSANIFLFNESLNNMIDKSFLNVQRLGTQFHIEKIDLNKKLILRVIF